MQRDFDGVEIREPSGLAVAAADMMTWNDEQGAFRLEPAAVVMARACFTPRRPVRRRAYRLQQEIRRILDRGTSWAILSAARHLSPEDDADRAALLQEDLDEAGVVYQPMRGEWEGERLGADGRPMVDPEGRTVMAVEPEASFFIAGADYGTIVRLAKDYEQDAFIYGHEDGTAVMYYPKEMKAVPAGHAGAPLVGEEVMCLGPDGLEVLLDWDTLIDHEALSGPLTREALESAYAAQGEDEA